MTPACTIGNLNIILTTVLISSALLGGAQAVGCKSLDEHRGMSVTTGSGPRSEAHSRALSRVPGRVGPREGIHNQETTYCR